jgi:hypothetical protein
MSGPILVIAMTTFMVFATAIGITNSLPRCRLRRQPCGPHDLERVGGGAGAGMQGVIKEHLAVDNIIADVIVGDGGRLVGQLDQFQIIGGDQADALVLGAGADVGALPSSRSRLLVPRKISSMAKKRDCSVGRASSFSRRFRCCTSA